jgi:hypothetical protein
LQPAKRKRLAWPHSYSTELEFRSQLFQCVLDQVALSDGCSTSRDEKIGILSSSL